MESLLDNLCQFQVTPHLNSPHAAHPRFNMYKMKSSGSSQEERRRQILEARKLARYDFVKHLRQIEGDEEIEVSPDDTLENMDVEDPVAIYAKTREYKNFLMLSEWLVDVPESFETSYLALPCPNGKRCLVVCYKGWTNAYTKNGGRYLSFQSALPGGSYKTRKRGYTVLDCVFSLSRKTFYILDLICWNKSQYIDCDTSFRFAWLQSRISEYEENVADICNFNAYRFSVIPTFDCSQKSLENMLSIELPFDEDLDGILFYHKESHYTHGPSPLICWLKAFMLPEMLNIPVPEKFLRDRPANYTNCPAHINAYEEERKEFISNRKNRRKNNKLHRRMSETSSSALDEVVADEIITDEVVADKIITEEVIGEVKMES